MQKNLKKVVPDIFVISLKILASIFGSLKCVFLKCTFLGPQLNRSGLVCYLLNSSKAPAPRGLDNWMLSVLHCSGISSILPCTVNDHPVQDDVLNKSPLHVLEPSQMMTHHFISLHWSGGWYVRWRQQGLVNWVRCPTVCTTVVKNWKKGKNLKFVLFSRGW